MIPGGRWISCALMGLVASAVLLAVPARTPAAAGASNQALATTEAAALLAAARLPADATVLDREPAGDGGLLAGAPVQPLTPDLVARTAFFQAADQPADVLAFVASRMPSGAHASLSGSADGRTGSVEYRAFDRPRVEGRLALRRLLVTVTGLADGTTGIRVDAQVVWLMPHPAAAMLHGARDLTIFTGRRRIHIASAARVRQIAALLNAADVQEPGATPCPVAPVEPPHPRLVFRTRSGGAVVGYAHIRPTGCARADMVVGGKRFAAFDLTAGSGAQLLRVLTQLGALRR